MFFFFNDTATTEIYTLSLHDALPISIASSDGVYPCLLRSKSTSPKPFSSRLMERKTVDESTFSRSAAPCKVPPRDRKSTRLNSSHANISYAVFCLKKKNHQSLHLTST